jgi:hypothetical protein
MVYICLYMVNIWLIYKHWGFIKVWLSQFQVIQHLPYFSGSCIVLLSLSRLVSNIGSGEKTIRSAWWSFDPGDFGQGLEGLDSTVGFQGWIMLDDENLGFWPRAKFKMIWDDFRKLSFYSKYVLCFFGDSEYVSSMFGVSGYGMSWDVFHCGKNPRSEVRMVSPLSKACWLINNFIRWAEKRCFTCFTIHYIHY